MEKIKFQIPHSPVNGASRGLKISGDLSIPKGETSSLPSQKKENAPTQPTPEKKVLRPWQLEAVKYLWARFAQKKGGALYLQMRLGKTLAMISFLEEVQQLYPTLLLCPKFVMRTWALELMQKGINDFIIVEGTRDQKLAHLELADRTGIKYVICNYDSIVPVKSKKGDKKSTRTGLDVQKKSIIKSMIIDESVRVSNPRASITKFLLKHFDHIKYKYLLSGNPAPENESQYCTQMILAHGHFMLYKAFWQFQHYCYNQIGFEKIPKAGVRDQIYDFVHKNAFVLTRSEAGLKNLKEYVKHFIPMTKTQSTAYKAMLVKYQYKQIEAMNELTQLTYLQQLAAGIDISEPDGLFLGENKINHILKLLSKEGDLYGQQVIIWSRFTSENKEIFRRLTEAGYSIELVDGSVIPEARENIRLRFNAHLTQITCATIRSMYSGTDWSGADTAIYTSNEASWDLRSQSEDRIYSVSKSRPLQIIDLCSEKTIDEEIVDLLREKKIDSNFFLSKLYARIKQMKEENA